MSEQALEAVQEITRQMAELAESLPAEEARSRHQAKEEAKCAPLRERLIESWQGKVRGWARHKNPSLIITA